MVLLQQHRPRRASVNGCMLCIMFSRWPMDAPVIVRCVHDDRDNDNGDKQKQQHRLLCSGARTTAMHVPYLLGSRLSSNLLGSLLLDQLALLEHRLGHGRDLGGTGSTGRRWAVASSVSLRSPKELTGRVQHASHTHTRMNEKDKREGRKSTGRRERPGGRFHQSLQANSRQVPGEVGRRAPIPAGSSSLGGGLDLPNCATAVPRTRVRDMTIMQLRRGRARACTNRPTPKSPRVDQQRAG